MELDRALYRWINSYVGDFPLLDSLVRLLINEYFVPVGLALGLLFLWFGGRGEAERRRWQEAVIVAAFAVGLANLAVAISNSVYYRQRPFVDMPDARLLFYPPPDSTFPSNGTALGFAIATSVLLRAGRASWPFYALALAFCLARLFGGIHYPFDILGGAAVGVLGALLADLLLRRLEPFVARVIAAMHRLGVALGILCGDGKQRHGPTEFALRRLERVNTERCSSPPARTSGGH